MQRSKRLVILAHCILNQNCVVRGLARAPGAFSSVANLFINNEIGVIQLPCPELTYLGESRPSMSIHEYDTGEYRTHCQKLIEPLTNRFCDYIKNGYKIVGLIGIQDSPSCGVLRHKGVFMEIFEYCLKKRGIAVPKQEIPLEYGWNREVEDGFVGQLNEWF